MQNLEKRTKDIIEKSRKIIYEFGNEEISMGLNEYIREKKYGREDSHFSSCKFSIYFKEIEARDNKKLIESDIFKVISANGMLYLDAEIKEDEIKLNKFIHGPWLDYFYELYFLADK